MFHARFDHPGKFNAPKKTAPVVGDATASVEGETTAAGTKKIGGKLYSRSTILYSSCIQTRINLARLGCISHEKFDRPGKRKKSEMTAEVEAGAGKKQCKFCSRRS
jgi:hypothetical protein